LNATQKCHGIEGSNAERLIGDVGYSEDGNPNGANQVDFLESVIAAYLPIGNRLGNPGHREFRREEKICDVILRRNSGCDLVAGEVSPGPEVVDSLLTCIENLSVRMFL
jgi:hypothetical protein